MLTLAGVTHTYRDGTKALDDVTLSIPTGMFGLLGPNGAGKSTLMRSIATLQTPSQGSIRFGDIDVVREPGKLRATLGYLPQDFGVYPRVSAYELLSHLAVLKGFSSAGERKTLVEGLLNQVNLWSVRKKAVSGFSGGMRQRFGIAQALIGNPSLIIVDEPTAGLDPEERNRFNNLLAKIGENVVVILSTHIVDDVADMCSRMAIIHEGRIILEGSPSQLTGALKGRVWRRRVTKEAPADLQKHFNVISSRLRGGNTVIHVLADQKPGEGFEPVEAELEDLYFATLTEKRRLPAAA
jgi:ABC-type multidrug transport system ATPase subunit